MSSTQPSIRPYQMLPLKARVDLRDVSIKGYSTSPKDPASDCLVSCPKHLLSQSKPSAEMQPMYSAAPDNWAKYISDCGRFGPVIPSYFIPSLYF